MTKRQFVVLVFRLFSLYLLFNLVTNLGYIYRMVRQPDYEFGGGQDTIGLLAAGFVIFIALTAITLLWRRSEWLMQKVFAIPALSEPTMEAIDEPEASTGGTVAPEVKNNGAQTNGETILIQDYYETPVSMEALEVAAISIVGLLEAFGALPRLMRDLELLLWSPSSVVSWIRIGGPEFIQVGLGLFLFLRPWQVQQWIAKLKPQSNYDDDAGAQPTAQV